MDYTNLTTKETAQYAIRLLKSWQADVFPSFEAKEIQPFPTWTEENFKLTKSTGGAGQFIPFPYQRGVMILMTMTGLEKLVVFKSAQIGYTQMLLAWYFYETTHRARSTILYQPTDGDAKDFTTSQLDEVLAICPNIASELVVVRDGGKANKKDSANTTQKKVFKDAIGYILGAKAANAFRRRSAPSIGLDEVDGMDLEVEGEGRPDKLAASRTAGVSTAIKMIFGSTPTTAGASLMEILADEIKIKLRRYYPCLECGFMQWLRFGGPDDPSGMKWDNTLEDNEAKARSCWYKCKGCGHRIEYSDMPEMDEKARWQDPDQHIYLDEEHQCFRHMKTDEIVGTPLAAVIYMNSLMSYTYEWWRFTKAFLDAKDAVKNGDVGPLMNWLNHQCGELFFDKGEKAVSKDRLLERCKLEVYSANALPSPIEKIVIGCDVQGDRIEYGIYGFGYGEECWCIEYHRVQGNPATTNVLERALRVDAERKFQTVDGRALGVELVCVDSGHLAQTVYDFCSHDPQKYLPIKGSNQIGDSDIVWPKNPTEGTYRVRLGTQALKDTIATRVTFEDIGAGFQHWPNDEDMFGENYFHGFTAETRKLRRVAGKPVRMWVCPSGRDNEPWDVHVYALAAIRILQRYYGFKFTLPSAEDQESRQLNVERAPVQHAALQNPNSMDLEAVMNRMAGG